MNEPGLLRTLFLLAPLGAGTGCMTTNLYTTPDTLAAGKVQAVGMLDAWQIERNMSKRFFDVGEHGMCPSAPE